MPWGRRGAAHREEGCPAHYSRDGRLGRRLLPGDLTSAPERSPLAPGGPVWGVLGGLTADVLDRGMLQAIRWSHILWLV